MSDRLNYFRRIFRVYLTREKGYLSFWHEKPAVSRGIRNNELGIYYQTFEDKASYAGPKDKDGVILFDYFFDIGRQYNPLAIAQYGLGHYNKHIETRGKGQAVKSKEHLEIARIQADWLVNNLEENNFGIRVWKHKFRWHYKEYLEAGWYSAHSQGTGISLLGRIYQATGDKRYLETAKKAFLSLNLPAEKGGVQFIDENKNIWLEEYLIKNPTHILNGFLWALWGVWDFLLLIRYALEQKTLSRVEGLQKEELALKLWNDCVITLKKNLPRYDADFWSLYDLSEQTLKMLASPFYHKLHIVQLKIMYILTREPIFDFYVKKFEEYQKSWLRRNLALVYKVIFKVVYF
jgi:hypothetical protein